ncbi:hypothetical protein NT6N_06060 [Oceaniferula spumae]|uniref:peptidoglycan glycosyltransferase n=1 Tax=Oceaniferula spumae TaxID=2979115 RepID=A0AAT9FHV5_9BACT
MKIQLPSWLRKRPERLRRKCGLLLLSGLTAALAGYFILPFAFPVPDSIASGPRSSLVLLDRYGEPLDHWVRKDYYRHRTTSLDDLPDDLVKATLAAEDKRFYQHGGVDVRATARALRDSWESKRFVSGASTVTQQTVKLSSQKASRTLPTKLRECLTARHVEMIYDKDHILTAYFNHLDYGNRSQGPLQAARHYFGKPLSQLSLAECALLAGLPQAPSRLNPRRNPEAAIKRRNWILDRMSIVYQIPPERIEVAKAEPLKLNQGRYETTAPHLAQLMQRSRQAARSPDETQEIRTSISATLQRDVTAIIQEQIKHLRDKHIQHAAVVVIDNASGEVLVHVGSAFYAQQNGGQIDAARTPRSPGSALKPFTYLLAFENGGMTPATIIEDIPTRYSDTRGEKHFVNYNRHHQGPVTIHHALANSLNVPAVRTLNAVGGADSLKSLLEKLGISTLDQDPVYYGLGLTLGSGEVTLLELTNAYASLARMGIYKPVSYLAGTDEKPQHVASYQSCWMLAQTMTDNSARSAAFGPNSPLRFPFPCAVKTGTSTDFRDNWCLGFTKDFTVGVWAGNLDNSPMRGISGVSGAGPIFHETMMRLHRDHRPKWFARPTDMTKCMVHIHTGKRMTQQTGDTITLDLPNDRLPLASQRQDFDIRGRTLLDIRYADWMTEEGDKNSFAISEQNTQMVINREPLRILSPSREARYLLDPDLPGNGRFLKLATDFPGAVSWTCPTLKIESIEGIFTAQLEPGEHLITITDDSGRSASRKIIVEQL